MRTEFSFAHISRHMDAVRLLLVETYGKELVDRLSGDAGLLGNVYFKWEDCTPATLTPEEEWVRGYVMPIAGGPAVIRHFRSTIDAYMTDSATWISE